jgi:hypothetical protein
MSCSKRSDEWSGVSEGSPSNLPTQTGKQSEHKAEEEEETMKVVSGTVDFSSRPRMIRCYLCGKEYGSKSISIHQPQCKQRWLLKEHTKPAGQRRAVPRPPPAPYVNAHDGCVAGAEARGAAGGDKNKNAVDVYNEAAYQVWCGQALQKCAYCHRSFTDDAYASHTRSCTADKPARKVGGKLFEGMGGGGAPLFAPSPERLRREAAATAPRRGKVFPKGLAAQLEGRVVTALPGVRLVTWSICLSSIERVFFTIRPTRVVTPGFHMVSHIGYTNHTGYHQLCFDCKIK